jgi:hypothetical protein
VLSKEIILREAILLAEETLFRNGILLSNEIRFDLPNVTSSQLTHTWPESNLFIQLGSLHP